MVERVDLAAAIAVGVLTAFGAPEPGTAGADRGAPAQAAAGVSARRPSGGGRDPFVAPGADRDRDVPEALPRPPGLAGLSIDDVALKGTVETPNGNVAILEGGGRSYVVRPGDALFDGVISTITADAIVLIEPDSREGGGRAAGARQVLRIRHD